MARRNSSGSLVSDNTELCQLIIILIARNMTCSLIENRMIKLFQIYFEYHLNNDQIR